MNQGASQDRFGIPYVLEGAFSYFPYNPDRIRPISQNRRLGQAVLASGQSPLATLVCDRDFRHFQVRGIRCRGECFLPEFVKAVLADGILPVAIAGADRPPYVVDYNAVLAYTDSGSIVNPDRLQVDLYDKLAIGEEPSLDGVVLRDTAQGVIEALLDCSPETQLVMLSYLIGNVNDDDSFDIFHGLVMRSADHARRHLLTLSQTRLGVDHKLTRLLAVAVDGPARQAVQLVRRMDAPAFSAVAGG